MRKQELVILFLIFGFVTIIFVTYILISLFSQRPTPQPSLSPSPKPLTSRIPVVTPIEPPSPQPTSLPSPLTGEITKPLIIDLLPIQTSFANIEYLSGNDTFVVTIKQNPYTENKDKVEQWFRDQGFEPEDLKIYWQTYPEVEK